MFSKCVDPRSALVAHSVKMKSNVVLFFAVMVFVASSDVFESRFSVEAQQHCCLPDKYTVEMIPLNTINSNAPTIFITQMNYDTQQQVLLNFTKPISPSGSRVTEDWDSKILIDYNKGQIYLILGVRPDQCQVFPFLQKLTKCIPDEATHLTRGYLGSLGSAGLTYDAWRFPLPMVSQGAAGLGQLEPVVTLGMSRDCVPLLEGVHFPEKPGSDQLYLFSNFSPKLVDPKAFELPDSCFQ